MIFYDLFGIEVPNWVLIVAFVLLFVGGGMLWWRKTENEENYIILSDGTKIKKHNTPIIASPSLPFDGNVFATYYAKEMLEYDLEINGDWVCEIVEYYLFKWATDGIIEVDLDSGEMPIIFKDWEKPLEELELELFEVVKKAGVDLFDDDVHEQYSAWGKKIAKIGEDELLQLAVIAKDSEGVMRFTPSGYKQAVYIKSFDQFIEEVDFSHEFQLLDEQTQKQQLGMALLIGATENIEEYVMEHEPTRGLIKLADDISTITM